MNFANCDGRTMLANAMLVVLSSSGMADETDDHRRIGVGSSGLRHEVPQERVALA